MKRYGVLFICMSSRAIHLEIANSLDSSSFISALRRLVARRGRVHHLYCDNGTNLVGAKSELENALREMNRDEVERWAADNRVSWHFNPPRSSHMGGSWERAIRTVRNVLYGLMQESTFTVDDESLHTLFCEVESIANS
jgi:hypothetical protein